MKNFDFGAIEENLKKATSVLITFPASADYETIAASLSLYLSLKEARKGVAIVSPVQATVNLANLVGINQVKQEIGSQDLVISFDYIQDSIEKVSYNIEDNKFNLVVQIKPGRAPLDPNSVNFSHTGPKGELVFVLGARSLNDLEEIYQKNQKLFEEALLVAIDNQVNNNQFGKVNLIDENALVTETIIKLIQALKLPVNEDIANNLFLGLKRGTSNFTKTKVTADTFEAAAFCLRYGAKMGPEERKKEKEVLEAKKAEVPPDWLGPKIFQSSRKV